uniref:Moesin/ezrin/radixin homolog 1 n=1 Tax=Plectus sambesii TaxID=2011161 RepID=A0A914W524_9BILA
MMRFGSGSYNVRDSETVKDGGRQLQRTLICSVHFLDTSHQDFELDRNARGQDLLDRVFEHLELIEKDFFGLQFIDVPQEETENNMRWLDPTKSIRKQMQCPPYLLYFRVKFYVSDPSKLIEEYTRYHFYMEIRKDILDGRLVCPESSAALLGSYAAQSEFGDYCPQEHGETYLDGYQFIPNQTTSLLKKIQELHKLHRGQSPAEAEFNFLDHAKRLEMYGVDLYGAKDPQGTSLHLGVTSYGLAVFQNFVKINSFSWSRIMKLSFKRKQFFVQIRGLEEADADTVVVFNLSTTQSCKLLWKSCIEHHTFFRLIAPPTQPSRSLFSLGSRYRYSGRTEYQTLEEMKRRARIERTFHRSGSKMSYARSTVGPSSLLGERRLSSAVDSTANTPLASPVINGRRESRELTNGFCRAFLPRGADESQSPAMMRTSTRASSFVPPSGAWMAASTTPNNNNGVHLPVGNRLSRSWSAAARNGPYRYCPRPSLCYALHRC